MCELSLPRRYLGLVICDFHVTFCPDDPSCTTPTTLPPATTTTTLPWRRPRPRHYLRQRQRHYLRKPQQRHCRRTTTTTTCLRQPQQRCHRQPRQRHFRPKTCVVDGTVDPGEECDDGTANGTTTCGCQSDCTYTPADTACDDGLFCTEGETCDGEGACQAGIPVVCDDGLFCTVNSCDEASDMCVITGDSCDDGVDCTEDICDEAEDSCTNTPDDAFCDDEELCTTDSCDEVAGCIFTPVECPEGQQCDSSDGAMPAGRLYG